MDYCLAVAISLKQERTVGKLIARAWTDEDFKRRLLGDPVGVLREVGLAWEDFMKIVARESHLAFALQGAEGISEILDFSLSGKPNNINDEEFDYADKAILNAILGLCRACCSAC